MQFQELGARLERLQVQLQEKAASNAQMHARLQATVRAAKGTPPALYTSRPALSNVAGIWRTSSGDRNNSRSLSDLRSSRRLL